MAMKRNADSTCHTTVKRVCSSENTMQSFSFNPENVPSNMFHLGESNYVVVSDFSDVIRIHIRFYKLDFSGCLKPTRRGITLTTSLWQALSAAMDSIPSSELKEMTIIENSLLLSTEQINGIGYISIQRFFQRNDLTRKFVPSIGLISQSEWDELKKMRKEISSLAVRVMFGRVFQGLLLWEVQRRTPTSVIQESNEDAEIILTTSMSELLSDYLKSNIEDIFICNGCEMSLGNQLGHECVTQNNEIRARIYGDRAFLKIDLSKFINDYVERNSLLAGLGVLAVSVWLYLDSSAYLGEGGGTYLVAIFVLMAAGAFMILVGMLGCCGALQESPCLLGTFFIFLLVIFAAEVTGGVWAWMYRDEVDKIIEVQVTKMVKDEYGANQRVEKTIDAVQHDLQCCGAMRPEDWAHSRLNSNDKSAVEVGISKTLGYYELPSTCCKDKDPTICDVHRKVKFAGHYFNGIHTEGCIPRLQRYFKDNILIMIGIGIGIGIIQILGFIFSMALCCTIRREEV